VPGEADEGLMKPIYQDRDLRGKVLSAYGESPEILTDWIMRLMAGVWVQGFHAGRGDAG
jgi:hypothetical protein